jgi:hypothetical protein
MVDDGWWGRMNTLAHAAWRARRCPGIGGDAKISLEIVGTAWKEVKEHVGYCSSNAFLDFDSEQKKYICPGCLKWRRAGFGADRSLDQSRHRSSTPFQVVPVQGTFAIGPL